MKTFVKAAETLFWAQYSGPRKNEPWADLTGTDNGARANVPEFEVAMLGGLLEIATQESKFLYVIRDVSATGCSAPRLPYQKLVVNSGMRAKG